MKRLNWLHAILILPLLLVSCQHIDNTVYGSIDKMVAEKKVDVSYVSAEQLEELIATSTPGLKIIDVREPEEYVTGHIPGAINIPRGILEFSSQLTNRREKIYLYSDLHNRSTLAVRNLELLKFGRVCLLEGGLDAWKNAFPEKIEEGGGAAQTDAPAKKASSGGCGD
ncbi:MAG: hypothetical protein IH597_05285 [Bacteroidales bacterium]|nr:hypothetical protein [Bacteroidales bacterium]